MSHPNGLRSQFAFAHCGHTTEGSQRQFKAWRRRLCGSTGERVAQKLEVFEQVCRSESRPMVLRDNLRAQIDELPTARRAPATRFHNERPVHGALSGNL